VLRADVGVAEGRGYFPAGRFKAEDPRLLGPDAIPIDAMFSPIRRVTFTVSQARVGEATDYDKLTLEIVTSGAVAPREALKQAGRLLVAHTAMWINFDELPEPELEVVDQVAVNAALFQSVNELEFSVRALNCLQSARIELVGDLAQRTERDLMGTRNFGRKSLAEIQAILGAFGLTLGMKIDQWEQMKVAWHTRQKTGFDGDA
jgi:DNA-directed RNA polymerase subunit alpha